MNRRDLIVKLGLVWGAWLVPILGSVTSADVELRFWGVVSVASTLTWSVFLYALWKIRGWPRWRGRIARPGGCVIAAVWMALSIATLKVMMRMDAVTVRAAGIAMSVLGALLVVSATFALTLGAVRSDPGADMP